MDLSVKKLGKDVDALILYALVAVYVFVPDTIRVQAVDRLDDPLAIALLAAAGAGRFAVRVAATNATGRVRVERLAAIRDLPASGPMLPIAQNLPAGVTHINTKKTDTESGPDNA